MKFIWIFLFERYTDSPVLFMINAIWNVYSEKDSIDISEIESKHLDKLHDRMI